MRTGFTGKICFLTVVVFSIFLAGCSQPVMESEGCRDARDSVKRLYSIHIDQGPNPAGEKLETLRPFISPELAANLSAQNTKDTDYLTQYEPFPKAFRAGTCRDTHNGPEFDVLLFWRRSDKNIEEKLVVTAVKKEKWVVNNVRRGNK